MDAENVCERYYWYGFQAQQAILYSGKQIRKYVWADMPNKRLEKSWNQL
jgi:hypothetical protein